MASEKLLYDKKLTRYWSVHVVPKNDREKDIFTSTGLIFIIQSIEVLSLPVNTILVLT